MRAVLLLVSLLAAWLDWDAGNPRFDRFEAADQAVAAEDQLGRSLDSPFAPPIPKR
jgi:hypothetical protein